MRAIGPIVACAALVASCTATDGEPDTVPSDPTTTAAGSATTTAAGTSTDDGATTSPSSAPVTEPAPVTGVADVCWASPASEAEGPPTFSDQTESAGLLEPLTGMHVHAAGFGDFNGDEVPDLVVGTFANRPPERYAVRGAQGPTPDVVLVGGESGFASTDGFAGTFGRTSGLAIVDLDADGDSDLVLARNWREGSEIDSAPSTVYENIGAQLLPVDAGLDPTLGGRSIGVFDYDGDGLPDLLITVDRYRGGSSRLYRNLGGLRFEDVTEAAGLPEDLPGFGVATSDIDNDGDVDFFVAGQNRLYLDVGNEFRDSGLDVFAWPVTGKEDDVTGASFGDVDRDGRPDLVVGQHFNSTVDFGRPAPVRLFLNRTEGGGAAFVEVTEEAGLVPLPTKAPHVQIADIDNDGWPDIVTSASGSNGTRPALFMSQGLSNGVIRFSPPEGLGSKQYWVTAPVADVDRDGRLDVLLAEWEPTLPSILLKNETRTGHWLSVSVDVGAGSGIGGRVRVYEAGGMGDQDRLLGSADIVVTTGYTAGVEPIAHLGLGKVGSVDVAVGLPDGTTFSALGVAADQHVRLPGGCG